jgi:hypothetical protein
VEVTADDAAVRLAVGKGGRRTVVELAPSDALALANAVLEATRTSRRGGVAEPVRPGRGSGPTDGAGPTATTGDHEEFTRGGGADDHEEFTRGGGADDHEEFTRGGGAGADAPRTGASGDADFTRGGGDATEATRRGAGGSGRGGRRTRARDVWTTCHECGFSWTHSGGGSRTECPACETVTVVGSY